MFPFGQNDLIIETIGVKFANLKDIYNMTSILTNNGAINALQALRMTNKNLGMTQNQVATGKSISSAKDSASLWSIAKIMETDKEAFESIHKSLGVTGEIVATGLAGAERVTDLLKEMKILASNASSDGFDFATVDKEIKAKKAQIESVISGTQANGVNLLSTNGINGTTTYTALASLDRGGRDINSVSNGQSPAPTTPTPTPSAGDSSNFGKTGVNTITINSLDLQAKISEVSISDVTDAASAKTVVGELENLIKISVQASGELGVVGKRIADQNEFVSKLADSLEQGIGSIVDADLEEASARLQALQAQQQLGIQALSIANQAPQSILSLFR